MFFFVPGEYPIHILYFCSIPFIHSFNSDSDKQTANRKKNHSRSESHLISSHLIIIIIIYPGGSNPPPQTKQKNMRVSISLFSVLALAVVSVSGTGLNLNELSPLTTADVTPGCLSAYSADIPACPDSSSFQAKTAVCTSACTSALTAAQQAVILSCRQSFVSPDGLLRRLLDGGLVAALCPRPASSSAASSRPSASSSAVSARPSASSSAVSSRPSATPTASRLDLTGFLTMTITPPSSTASNVPDELTLDDSVAPTVASDDAYSVPTQASLSVPAAAAENTNAAAPTRTPLSSYVVGAPAEGGAGRTGGAVVLMVLMAAAAAAVVVV